MLRLKKGQQMSPQDFVRGFNQAVIRKVQRLKRQHPKLHKLLLSQQSQQSQNHKHTEGTPS